MTMAAQDSWTKTAIFISPAPATGRAGPPGMPTSPSMAAAAATGARATMSWRSSWLSEEGAIRGVLFTSKDAKPYSYLVAVRVKGEILFVFEAFFPDPEALGRRLAAVQEALRRLP